MSDPVPISANQAACAGCPITKNNFIRKYLENLIIFYMMMQRV
jgi:hypothetical protein